VEAVEGFIDQPADSPKETFGADRYLIGRLIQERPELDRDAEGSRAVGDLPKSRSSTMRRRHCSMVQWCNGAMVQWCNGAMVPQGYDITLASGR